MDPKIFSDFFLLFALLTLSMFAFGDDFAPDPTPRELIIERAAEGGNGLWGRVNGNRNGLQSRSIYSYCLALCEAGKHPERLPLLLETGAAMQDRDPESVTFGNFQWRWGEKKIQDMNAVQFCMMSAAPMWKLHAQSLPEDARETLRETIEYAIHGCLNQAVPTSYTNIGLMKSLNLILIGEMMNRPDVFRAGNEFFDAFIDYTRRFGTHEYCSPTYHGVSLSCLNMMEALCEDPAVKQKARTLLELFWTDIAASWHPGAQRLTGTCSRTYDFIQARGHVHDHLNSAGWIPGQHGGELFTAFSDWQPPQELFEFNRSHFPRTVRQSWGPKPHESRTAYICSDITLSASGSIYATMDQPLVVDFTTRPGIPRAYFIPDGREDPYGTNKYNFAGHQKAHHLHPSWFAAQRGPDALGLAVYRRMTRGSEDHPLQSHLVLPEKVDALLVNDQPAAFPEGETGSIDLAPDDAVIIRIGTACAGFRVPLARGINGQPAGIQLIRDGNPHGVIRISVRHAEAGGIIAPKSPAPVAAFQVRIGSGLDSEEAFAAWREEFLEAAPQVSATDVAIRLETENRDGNIAIDAEYPWISPERLTPEFTRFVLEINGEDVGGRILREGIPEKK